MTLSLEKFVSTLTKSGVMSETDFAAFWETVPDKPETVEDLAKVLIEQKKLTKFQTQLIYQDKADGLSLGNYLILDKIGAGGMGQVYLARHRRMDRRVALKTLPKSTSDDPQAIQRFHREVKAAAKLSHPNIVTAHDADEAKGLHFLVTEYVQGVDLSVRVKQQGVLSIQQAVDYIMQAAKGLGYAHEEGIIHRDIKPANMLLTMKGVVKVLDMGLARLEEGADEKPQTALTQTGAVMGTIDYMAPEQAVDTHTADARSDIYSLGCVLHYLLTGDSVYTGDTMLKRLLAHRDQPIPSLRKARPDVPKALDQLFQKMVAKQPQERQQSMSEVIAELGACGVLEPPTGSSSITKAALDSDYRQFLQVLEVEAEPTIELATIAQTAPTAAAPQETLASGFLDETISGNAVAVDKQGGGRLSKKLLAIAAGCLAVLLLAAGLIIKLQTPAGTIILEIDQPELAGAEVTVDGEKKITIKMGEGKEPIQIEGDEKTHQLKVTKGGFETFTKAFTVKAGESQTIKVRLEPLPKEKMVKQKLVTEDGPSSDNYALSFDGQGSYVSIDGPLVDGANPVTIEACVRIDEDKQFAPIANLNSTLYLKVVRGKLDLGGITSQSGSSYHKMSQLSVSTNRLVYLAAVYDGSTLEIFINGRKSYSDRIKITNGKSSIDNTSAVTLFNRFPTFKGPAWHFGTHPSSGEHSFHGTIDEIHISKVARYTKDYTPKSRLKADEHTIALYHFDEGQGYLLKDSSGKGHHGKIHGATWVKADGSPIEPKPRIAKTDPAVDPHRAVAERVLELGGSVGIGTSRSPGYAPKTKEELPKARFAVQTIYLVDCDKITVDDMRLFGTLGTVKVLQLSNTSVADEHLAAFRRWDSLQSVHLGNTAVSDAGVEALSSAKNLRFIDLTGTKITDNACKSLANIETLRWIRWGHNEIGDTGLHALSQLPHLRQLDIPYSPKITDAGLSHLAATGNLQWLELYGSTALGDDIVPALSTLKTLRYLDLRDAELTNAGVATLREALPNCNIVHPSATTPEADQQVAEWALDNGLDVVVAPTMQRIKELPEETFFAHYLTKPPAAKPVPELHGSLQDLKSVMAVRLPSLQDADEATKAISQLESLAALALVASGLSAQGLERLSTLTQLEQLHIGGCENLNDEALSALPVLPQLHHLAIEGNTFTDAGLIHLKAQVRLSSLILDGHRNLFGNGLKHLVELSKLSQFYLRSTSLTDEAALPHLKQMQQLRILDIMGTFITPQGAAELQAALPNCVVFHESLENVPWTLPAKDNYALSFDGRGSFVEIPNWSGTSFEPVTPITIEAKCRVISGEGQMIVVDSKAMLSFSKTVGLSGGLSANPNPFFRVQQGKEEKVADGTYWLSLVFTGADLRLYVDGKYVSSAISFFDGRGNRKVVDSIDAKDLLDSTGPWSTIIGTHSQWPSDFQGIIDEVRISNVARYTEDYTPTDRLEADEHTIALYHFDEGQRDVLKDSSGNGHHGKIHGATWVKADGSPIAKLPAKPVTKTPIPDDIAERHRLAAQRILDLGGKVDIQSGKVIGFVDELPMERFGIYRFELTGPVEITDDDWKMIALADSAFSARIIDTKISPAGMSALSRLEGLIHLDLNQSEIPPNTVGELQALTNLSNLNLAGVSEMTQADIDAVGNIQSLRTARFYRIGVESPDLSVFGLKSRLRMLALVETGLSDGSLDPLKECQHLTDLNLGYNPLSDGSLDTLLQLKGLKHLDIRTQITAEAAQRLQESLPDCIIRHPGLKLPESERDVASWVLEQNGKVYNEGTGEIKDVQQLVSHVDGVQFSGDNVPSKGLQHLSRLKNLNHLIWSRLQNADDELSHLNTLDGLRGLHINGSDISAQGMSHFLALTSLEQLHLINSENLTGEEFDVLTKLEWLWLLYLDGTSVDDAGLKSVGQVPRLSQLSLARCDKLTGDGLRHLVPAKHLRRLYLKYSPIGDGAVPHLKQMSQLRLLDITFTKITPAAARELQEALPDCLILHEALDE